MRLNGYESENVFGEITVILEQTSYLKGVLISFTLKQCKIMTLQNNEQQYHIRDEDNYTKKPHFPEGILSVKLQLICNIVPQTLRS